MNLLTIRKLIGTALESTPRPTLDTADVLAVEYVNPLESPGPWALRVTVNDETGGTRVFRVDFTEEDQGGGEERYVVSLPRTQVLDVLMDADRNRFPDLDSNQTTAKFMERMGTWYRATRPKKGTATSSYTAGQARYSGDLSWRTFGTNSNAYDAGMTLAEEMQRHGLRYGEIGGESGHIADMINGEVLSADDGTEFRIIDISGEQGK
jgi:hypothetical protein